MSTLPTAKQVRSQAVREAIDTVLGTYCTAEQRAKLYAIHDNAPWKGLDNCPEDKLDETYELVRRTAMKASS